MRVGGNVRESEKECDRVLLMGAAVGSALTISTTLLGIPVGRTG